MLADDCYHGGHSVCEANDIQEARTSVAFRALDCAVVFVGLCRGQPPGKMINLAKSEWPTAEVIVVGRACELGQATQAVRDGAYDCLQWPASPSKLNEVLCGALRRRRIYNESQWRTPVDSLDEPPVIDATMRAILAKAERAAAVNSTVLITGESGTGKEVLACRIHRHSARRGAKFVPVNCGGLQETLVEAELFGYKKGAFTGAIADKKGLIDESKGGVLFLDEIGDAPLSLQVRLLRFLDSGEIRPVGGTSVKSVDVRVIAATNICLRSAVQDKRFREDLYFRLRVVSLHLPPLRERCADIPGFIEHYTRRAALRLGIAEPRISEQALSLLVRYDWPGNIRELYNVLEQALVQASEGLVTPQDLPPEVRRGSSAFHAELAPSTGDLSDEHIAAALRRYRGNRSAVAASLGISRTTLWRRLRDMELESTLPSPATPTFADEPLLSLARLEEN